MKMIFFWNVVPCNLVDIGRRFTGDGDSISETSISFYRSTRRNIPGDPRSAGSGLIYRRDL